MTDQNKNNDINSKNLNNNEVNNNVADTEDIVEIDLIDKKPEVKRKGKAERNINKALAAVSCILLLTVIVLVIVVLEVFIPKHKKANVGVADTQNVSETVGQDSESLAGTDVAENTEDTQEKESEEYKAVQIPNIESLDTTSNGWGQGSQVDELNRPVSAVGYQELYGKYNAYFIGENKQSIYLTFDEGYENGCTTAILDTLKEKDVKAVFFVTKPYAEQNPDLVRRMIDEGHVVGNHSVTHPSDGLPSQTLEAQQQEIVGCHDYIKENFGYNMHLFRYPTGKFSEQSLALVNNCNYKSVFWSFAYLDYDVNNQPDPSAALEKTVSHLHPGAIFLLHAVSQTNSDILGSFIDQTKAAGYTFELFD